jgi:hypothetical protein
MRTRRINEILTIKGHDIEVARSFKYLGTRCNSEIYDLYKDMNIVDDIQIRRRGWAGCIIRMGSKKLFLMGNFVIHDQWKNQEQDGRTSSGGTHHRS